MTLKIKTRVEGANNNTQVFRVRTTPVLKVDDEIDPGLR